MTSVPTVGDGSVDDVFLYALAGGDLTDLPS
jgi:hypothetical protein